MLNSLCMRLFPYSRMPKSSRRQSGGGVGAAFGFAPSNAHLINNELSWKQISSCGNTNERPGFLSGVVPTGLPGLKGGRRSRRGNRNSRSRKNRKSRKTQHGGRYGFTGPDSLVNGPPWGATYTPVSHVACEASRSTIPPNPAAGSLNVRGGELWTSQAGGSQAMAPATFGGSDQLGEPSIMIPTARYTQLDGPGGSFPTSAGTREMVNAPLGAAEMNPACLKTGGSRSLSRKIRNNIRKARKNAKVSPVKKCNLNLPSKNKSRRR